MLMCEKCVQLDKKIERYKRIRYAVADEVTADRIMELIEEMKAQKAQYHPLKE